MLSYMSLNDETIIIHKYASRRLYNTSTSKYVTLDDISRLIKKDFLIKILDKETGNDCTNQYLLQIISNYEEKNGSNLPENFLLEIIKSYNTTTQNFLPDLITRSFNFFKNNQEELLKNIKKTNNENENDIGNIFFSNDVVKNWLSFQERYFEESFKNVFNDKNVKKKYETNIKQNSENETLRKEINEIKNQLQKITKILKK